MSVPVFKDLDKSATELITKGFPTDSHGFELEGGSTDGVKFKATGTQTAEALDALFETTKTCSARGLTLKATAKADKNVPVYALEASIEPAKVVGLKATINSECKLPATGEENVNKLTMLYKRDHLTIEDSIAYSAGVVSLAGSMAIAYQAIRAGVSALATVTLNDKAFALGGYGFKVGYQPSNALSMFANYDHGVKGTTAGTTLYYIKDTIQVAGQVVIDPKEPTKVPGFIVALSHAHDAKTSIKAKVVTAKKSVALALKHQLSDSLSVTIASECACTCAAAAAGEKAVASTHKHGLSVNLKL